MYDIMRYYNAKEWTVSAEADKIARDLEEFIKRKAPDVI